MNFKSKVFFNFLWLFFSSAAIKGIGVLKESIVAAQIGNSLEFASFNTFRAVVDFLLAFAISVPVIESILVPKLAAPYANNKDISFKPIWNQATNYGKTIFITIFFILLAVAYIKSDNWHIKKDTLLWVLLFSIYLAISLSSSVMYSFLKAIGDFKMYSYMSFFNAIGTLILIYIFINFLGLKIIIISSVTVIIISNYILKKNLSNNFRNTDSKNQDNLITLKDFNLYRMVAVNHSIFIGYAGRLIIGMGTTSMINLYQYSFIIITSFLLVVVSNISSIILFRHSTANTFSQLKVIIITLAITVLANLVLYFFGKEIISLLYQRGKFTEIDTQNTFEFLKIFLVPYTFLAITQVVIQSHLKESSTDNTLFFKTLTVIIAVSICVSILFGFIQEDFKFAVKVLLYSSSISIFAFLLFKQKNQFFSKIISWQR